MSRLEALKELAAKVEAGTCDFDWGFVFSPSRKIFPVVWREAMNAYRGSLDAAKALHEALLPGYGWMAGIGAVRVFRLNDSLALQHESVTDNPARAWLLAILRALIAQEEGQ